MNNQKNLELNELEALLRRDFEMTQYPSASWVPERRTRAGAPVLDVLIIGGGQSGLGIAFGLMREKVDRVLVIDQRERNQEGPWLTTARMITLRTPKNLTGLDYGIPNLTFQAWYETQIGRKAWQEINLIPKEAWAEYLQWYRDFLGIPVRSQTRAGAIDFLPNENCFRIPIHEVGKSDETLYARKIVLATGLDGAGLWEVPLVVRESLPPERYAHTDDQIDFNALRGKRIAILGCGASAFDNGLTALNHGALEARMFIRRPEFPCFDVYQWANFSGFLNHHGNLPDAARYQFLYQMKRKAMGGQPPVDTYQRALRRDNFFIHCGCPLESIGMKNDEISIMTPKGVFKSDFVIAGTGVSIDLKKRPELTNVEPFIARWSDRFHPQPEDADASLLSYPYLGESFEFIEKQKGQAPYLGSIFNFNYGSLLSLGFGTAGISGIKYSLPKVVAGITSQIYRDDADFHLQSLIDYNTSAYGPLMDFNA